MIMMLRFLSLFLLLLALIKVFHKLWWTPIRIQKLISLRGTKGPPYRLLYGNGKEIINMQKEAALMPRNLLSHDIFPRLHPHIHSWTKRYGKNFLMWYGVQPVLVVTEPELCKEIFNNKDGAFPKPKPSDIVKKLFGDSLAMTEDEKWAKLRKLANHAFHEESLKGLPDITASAEAMVERWKNHEGKETDVFEEFRLLTSEVIARTAFGSSYLEGQNIFEMLKNLSIIVFKNLYKTRFPGMSKVYRTSDEIEADKLEKEIQDSIMEIVKKREQKASSREGESFGSDFLGLLLKAHHDTNDDQKFSIDNAVEECKALYFVGQETTSTLLSWTVLLLAQHPEWQEEARKEMSMVINETLRLYPPANLLGRIVPREVKLGAVQVPANVELLNCSSSS
ncbi:hypothetical protein ACLB2K_042835 [Fragaria x ananassa]